MLFHGDLKMNKLQYALKYADMGMAVLPLKPNKQTLIQGVHVEDASTNHVTVTRWWNDNQDANIGISSKMSDEKFISLDFDSIGADVIKSAEEKFGKLPDTMSTNNGNGRKVLFFKIRQGLVVKSGFVNGIFITGTDSDFITVPPYEEDNTVFTSDIPDMAELPEEWTELINAWFDVEDKKKEEPTEELRSIELSNGNFVQPLQFSSLDEIMNMDIPPLTWLVDDILPVGLTLVVAPPKYGKTFMCLDMAISIATGTPFIGKNTHKYQVLYCDLESSDRRVQNRSGSLLGNRTAPKGLFITHRVNDLDNGLIAQLTDVLERKPEIKLIIIDTYQYITGKDKGRNAYENDYSKTRILHDFATEHNIGLMLVHHTNKNSISNDSFDKISGSNGLMGGVDTVWLIEREDRSSGTSTLNITGRDVEAEEYELEFKHGKWTMSGQRREMEENRKRKEVLNSPITQTILRELRQNNGEYECTVKGLIDASAHTSTPIIGALQTIGKKLTSMSQDLLEYADVVHHVAKNGSGGSRHIFYIAEDSNPFEK